MHNSWITRAQLSAKRVGIVRTKSAAFSHVVLSATGLRKSSAVFHSFCAAFTNSFFTRLHTTLTALFVQFSPSSTRPIIKTTNI